MEKFSIRSLLLIISINVCLLHSSLYAQDTTGLPIGMGWKYIGSPGFSPDFASQVDLIFDSTGMPFLSFIEFSNPQKPSVMHYSNNLWSYVGNSQFSEGDALNLSMKLDKSGSPYCVFEDLQQNAKGAVFHLVDSIWKSTDTITAPGYVFWMPSITFDTNNILYVSYYNPFDYYIVVKKLVEGQWIDAGFPTDFIQQGEPSIFTMPNGELVISHFFYVYEEGVYKTVFFKYENNQWNLMPVGNILSDYLSSGKIYLSPLGEFYLAGVQTISNVQYISVQKLAGSQWHYVGSPQIHESHTYDFNMAFNKYGRPYISFVEEEANKFNILAFNDGFWESIDSTGNFPASYGGPYLAFNNENQLCIAFEDWYYGGKLSVMKYDTLYTGIQCPEHISQSFITIYPNPSTSELHIDTKVDFEKVSIYNIAGQEIYCVRNPERTFNIKTGNYMPGLYIVQFLNNNLLITKKFLIK
jgi:hypothetical protein